jgi:hypothetical protein
VADSPETNVAKLVKDAELELNWPGPFMDFNDFKFILFWLVVWNMNFIFPYIRNKHPN